MLPENQTPDFKELVEKARNGDIKAQYRLAKFFLAPQNAKTAKEAEGNLRRAVHWLKRAAARNSLEAKTLLGHCYNDGTGVTADYCEAAKWYRQAAEGGSAEAQFHLASYFEEGEGIVQNFTEAFLWYRRAADQGYVKAIAALGTCYADGIGVPVNVGEAFRHYQRAYKLGWKEAATEVFDLLARGETKALKTGLEITFPDGSIVNIAYDTNNRRLPTNHQRARIIALPGGE